MISKTDLDNLNEYRCAPGQVLSVYLDTDQSTAANRNRGFEVAFEAEVKAIQKGFGKDCEDRAFNGAVSRVRDLLATYKPGTHGLVIFARSDGPLWFRGLNVPIATEVRWGQTVYLQQFLEVLDEFQPYGVVLVDKSRGRIFTVALGQIERHGDIYALRGVRHVKTTGTDHLYSQSHFQCAADEYELSYLKRVVEVLEHVANTRRFDRLILAGANETTSNLFHVLPKSLRARVVSSAVLSANAPERDILNLVLALADKAERQQEMEKAEKLITSAAKGNRAVTTVPDTLQALNEKRVRELVYAEGFAVAGGICEGCQAVFPSDTMNCDLCGLPVKSTGDLLEFVVAAALAEGSTIEQLRGEAAEKLRGRGGIGAFLRF
jgi:peptide chain release factor subunit 1